jgi:hypothetical protein
MKGILLIFFISIVLTAILFSILYVLNDTAWGEWITNLIIHAKLT